VIGPRELLGFMFAVVGALHGALMGRPFGCFGELVGAIVGLPAGFLVGVGFCLAGELAAELAWRMAGRRIGLFVVVYGLLVCGLGALLLLGSVWTIRWSGVLRST
jgi:hypothetical protein